MLQKIQSILFILFLLVSADVIKWEYQIKEAPVVRKGIVYIEGGRSAMYAYGPQVAVRTAHILLPLGQKAKSVDIVYGNLKAVKGNVVLKPYIPAFAKSGNRTALRREAQQLVDVIYQKDELFPGIKRSVEMPYTGYLCGASIGIVKTTPVQYNPAREELNYYEKVTVTIETEAIGAEDDVAAYIGTPFSKSRIYQIVDNKQAVKALPISPREADDYDYFVASRPDLVSNWTPLIKLNTRRGMKTKVENISTIEQQGTGSDLAEKLRNWIKKEYEENKIVFAVLGGDVASGSSNMPYRLFYAKFYDHNLTPDRLNEITPASDMYFGTLDGNWNNNGNNRWGEPGEEDMFWEVFVSRMPVDNSTHLTNILNKTEKYSEQPVKSSVCNYLGLGEYLWTNEGVDVWGAMSIDHYIGYQKDVNGHTTYGISDNYTITRLDDRTGGGDGSWGASNLSTKFNQSKAAWVDHDGHGNAQIAYGINQTQISTIFQNDGSNANFFVGMTGACSPGKFHSTPNCFMEELLFTQKAAVAAISNNEYGFGDDDGDNSPTGLPYRYIHDAIFNPQKRVHFFEAMHAMGKEAVEQIVVDPDALSNEPWYGIIRYCCYTTNMFGDPALSVWTDTPKDLVESFEYTADATQFTMKTPPYTWVGLADATSEEIFTSQLTGYQAEADNSFDPSDSTCVINDQAYKDYAASNNKVKVYIKAHNYIAKSLELDISTSISNNSKKVIQDYSIIPAKGHLLIKFRLPANENVNLSIFNSKGALVKTVLKRDVKDGFLKIDNNEFSNGIYYCKLMIKNAQRVKSFIITK